MAYPKHAYPPPGYDCEYKHCCPHMNHISTTWVFGEYKRHEQYRSQLWDLIAFHKKELQQADARIKELEKENALLKAKYTALHQKQFKGATLAKKAAKEVPAQRAASPAQEAAPPRRKRGAPVGHAGWFRQRPQAFDHCVEIAAPTCCPHCCHENLAPGDHVEEHWVEDIILVPKTVKTLYRQATAYCPHCKKQVVDAMQRPDSTSHIGPNAKSTAIYLHHVMGISHRKTQRIMEELFGMKYAAASALLFDEESTQKGEPLYEDLREKIRATEYIHADETYWRQDGKPGYVWFAGNPELAFFRIADTRAGTMAADILGEMYAGVLVADGYQGYNAVHPRDRQSCLAHLIRKCDDTITEIKNLPDWEKHQDALYFCTRTRNLFSHACVIAKQEDMPLRTQKQNEIMQQVLLGQLEQLCANMASHPTAETFRKRLLGKEKENWFAFLRHKGVPPTNNHAEQSIRHIVIMRKTSFGTRSERGSERHGILQSLVQTAKRQGKNVREFIITLLTKDTATAQDALYRNKGGPESTGKSIAVPGTN